MSATKTTSKAGCSICRTGGYFMRDWKYCGHCGRRLLVLCRVPRSRRKYDSLMRELDSKPKIYFSFRFEGNFIWLTEYQFDKVKQYVTRARVAVDKLNECWS